MIMTCPGCGATVSELSCGCGWDLLRGASDDERKRISRGEDPRNVFPGVTALGVMPEVPTKAVEPAAPLATESVDRILDTIGMAAYAETFKRNDIDVDGLTGLTDDDLKSLGVESLGHRKKLLAAIASGTLAGARPSPSSSPQVSHASSHGSTEIPYGEHAGDVSGKDTSGMTVAGLILVVVSISLDLWGGLGMFGIVPLGLGIVLSHMGRGPLAIAGRVLGWLYVLRLGFMVAMAIAAQG